MLEILRKPWPWYVSGPLIGLMVPVLLIAGNKIFGISSSLRHICSILIPANIPYFKYDWKKEAWNIILVSGVLAGGLVAATFLEDSQPVIVNATLAKELSTYGITDFHTLVPKQLFSFPQLFTLRGFLVIVAGGFLVGFGTRYAGGCTSGHSIMGLSNLQLPSLIATVCFMVGGFITANLILPIILML